MQIKKAGVVAAGALATVAVMGAPAAAAPAPQADASAFTKASALNMARGAWSNPWDTEPQALAAAGTGSKISAAAWQVCASAAMAGVGGTVDADPNTLIGADVACNNANALLDREIVPALLSVLNDAAVYAAPWQSCAGTVMGGVGGTVALGAPNTVFGACRNANVVITAPQNGGRYTESTTVEEAAKPLTRQAGQQTATVTRQGASRAADFNKQTGKVRTALVGDTKANAKADAKADARWPGENPWDQEPMGLASVGTGSVVNAAPWQVCAGQAVWGVGGVVGAMSPNTAFGDCDNNNVWIDQPEWWQHLISALDYAHISAASWQVCGSDVVAGVGGSVSLTSPDTVFGSCNNDNTVIH